MKIHFIYGTESGNAQYLCDDFKDATPENFECEISEMNNVDATNLDGDTFYVIVSATFGTGDVPSTAEDFYDDLLEEKPDLSHIKFAVFGLGDESFGETFAQGSQKLMEAMLECKAHMIGERGIHDASGSLPPEVAGLPWWEGILAKITA